MSDFGMITSHPLGGDEEIDGLGLTALDFWRWSSSNLISNTVRGVLAEFIVARVLGDASPTLQEWDPYDVTTPEGVTVEVKSASYIQSWHQVKVTCIDFRIAPTKSWDASTNTWGTKRKRQAEVYVFALLDCKDQACLNPLDTSQWRFFVLATRVLNERKPEAQTIGLTSLEKLGPIVTDVDGLSAAVKSCAGR